MNPKEYCSSALITESCDFPTIKTRVDDQMIRLLHAGTGFSSELGELTDAYADTENKGVDWVNLAEEAGDLSWYTAVAINAFGFDPEEISAHETIASQHPEVRKHSIVAFKSSMLATAYFIGEYNDLLKKKLFYGKEIDLVKMKQILQQLQMCIAGLCIVSGTTPEECRKTNIDKLKVRYGEKFTAAAALNRDLETERKILEGTQS